MAGEGGQDRWVPTGCWGCLPTTRVSDNVVVAVADIFLFIFPPASLSAELASPETTRDLGN